MKSLSGTGTALPLRKDLGQVVAEALLVSVVFSAIVFLSQWRFGFNWADEGMLWYLSQRIHVGQMPIRDFYSYDPGRYLWSAAWFKALGGEGLFEQRLANACFGAIGLALAYAAMMAAQLRRPLRIVTVALLAIALGFPQHKIYEQALSLIAVALLARVLFDPADLRRWMLLGLATGVAAIIGRNSGLFYAIATAFGLILAWRRQRASATVRGLASYAAGTVIGYAPMIVWFAADSRFREAMIRSILFTSQWQAPLPIPFPWRVAQSVQSVDAIQITAVSWLCVVVLAFYAASAIHLLSALARKITMDRVLLLEAAALFTGVPYLFQAFDRADFAHIAQGILPVFIVAIAQWHRAKTVVHRGACVAFGCLLLVAWLPSEPHVVQSIAYRRDPASLVHFAIDGRNFIIDRDRAQVLARARREFDACHAGPGQFIAMPHYPGIYAYLHTASPIWEIYYLYPRAPEFQLPEIARIEALQTRVALVNTTATVDGRDDRRIGNTNPVLLRYIEDHFQRLPAQDAATSDFGFYERDCPK